MSQPGPLQFAFRTAWQHPSLALAEIAWRWLYWLTAAGAALFAVREVLAVMEVGRAELVLAGISRQLFLGRVLSEALPLLLRAGVILVPTLALLWVGLASLGRAASVGALAAWQSPARAPAGVRWSAMVGLNLARVVLALAAALSWIGAGLVCFSGVPSSGGEQAVWVALAVWFASTVAIWLAWCWVDWFLELATLYAVRDGQGCLAAVNAAVALFHSRLGSCMSVNAWFAFCRMALFLAVSTMAVVCVAAAASNRFAVVATTFAALLMYSAASSWLCVAWLAAYVHLSSRSLPSASEFGDAAEPLPSFS